MYRSNSNRRVRYPYRRGLWSTLCYVFFFAFIASRIFPFFQFTNAFWLLVGIWCFYSFNPFRSRRITELSRSHADYYKQSYSSDRVERDFQPKYDKFCVNCGEGQPLGNQYCQKCGVKVIQIEK